MNYSYKDDQGTIHTIKCNEQEVYAIARSLDLNPSNPYDLMEAQYVWACDHGKIIDPDQQDLNNKASNAGAGLHVTSNSAGKRRAAKRKPNETKIKVINDIAAFLIDNTYNNVNIVNAQGEISFSIGDKEFSIKLTQHRTK